MKGAGTPSTNPAAVIAHGIGQAAQHPSQRTKATHAVAFFAPVQRLMHWHVTAHRTRATFGASTALPWPFPQPFRPKLPPRRGAQSRPRLAPGLNGPVLTTPPSLGIARPGAASRPVLVRFHMTGFDGFLHRLAMREGGWALARSERNPGRVREKPDFLISPAKRLGTRARPRFHRLGVASRTIA